MNKRELIYLNDTNFIYKRNFSGNPERDKYGNTARRGNIIIPDEETLNHLVQLGINVKSTKPRDGEEEGFEPVWYMPVIINFESDMAKARPPKIYLVKGEDGEPELLDDETVGQIDAVYVTNVKATIEVVYLQRFDKMAAYIRTMYVFTDADDDPWASEFNRD